MSVLSMTKTAYLFAYKYIERVLQNKLNNANRIRIKATISKQMINKCACHLHNSDKNIALNGPGVLIYVYELLNMFLM